VALSPGYLRPVIDHHLLGVYLNDHLSGATGGVELFRRAASAQTRTANRSALQELLAEVIEDRQTLEQIMQNLEVPVRRYKVAGGWALEKVGRLKLNGTVLRRSPLSDVVELEGMRIGVAAKDALWLLLHRLSADEPRLDPTLLERLHDRAVTQLDKLEELRLTTAATAFTA
jgi:hypothetical protein